MLRHFFFVRMPIPLVMTACLLSGCNRQPEVGHYTAPKEFSTDTKPPLGERDESDRMLAALVLHGSDAWFFKLAGAKETVDQQAGAFDKVVQSVHFPSGDNAEPEWTVPDGWESVKSESQVRFATLKLSGSDPAVEITVSSLPWPPKNFVAMLHQNVNRWRGQLQLKSVGADELADYIREAKIAAGDAIFVDFKGKLKAEAMQPPFAAGMTGKLPAGHPPMTSTNSGAAKSTKAETAPAQLAQATPTNKGEKAATAENKMAGPPKLPFEYTMPDDWGVGKAPTFAIAAFAPKDGASGVDISVTPMGGAGGDLLGNVNRWRGQLKLQPVGADDLAKVASVFKIGGQEGHVVKLTTEGEAADRAAITAAMVKANDTVWVFRMRGPAGAVGKQQENFEKFLSSIKFGAGEK